MGINLGNINDENGNQSNVGGLKLNNLSGTTISAPKNAPSSQNNMQNIGGLKLNNLPSQKKEAKKKKKKSILDHVGDFLGDFGNEAKEGFNNFIKLPGRAKSAGEKIINESEAFKDGYDFGDISKTFGSTALSTVQNFGEGAIRKGEELFDAGSNLFGGASDWVNTKLEKAVGMHKGKSETEVNREKGKARKEMIQTNYTDKLMNAVGKDDFYKDLVESNSIVKTDNFGGIAARELGGQAVNLLLANATGSDNKLIQSLPLATSAYGSGVEQAYQNGANWDEANRYGLLNAATETATEWLFDGIPGMKGSKGKGIDYFAEKYLFHEPIEKSSKTLAKSLLKSGYKLVGENTEEVLADLINPYLKQFTYEYNSNKDVFGNLKEATSKLPTAQDLLQTIIVTTLTTGVLELPSSVSDISGTLRNNNINSSNNTSTVLNETNPNNINNQTIENTSKNGLKLANNSIPENPYQYVPSDNQKIDNLRKDIAELNWDNSEQTNNYVNMLEKIITDKGVDIRFDTNLVDGQGRIANGKYENGAITINPNSDRAGEFIAIHELTHAIGTDSMRNIIESYRKSNKEFDTAINELLGKTYNTNELTEEAMADVAGQLFGNQEFINNLSKTNPSLFKRIYNEIKYLWHQFTGYKNQNQFIKDLQYKWEQAYRSNNKLNSINSYSIQKTENGTRYVNIDTDQSIFDGIDPKDYNKIAKMYINDYLKGETSLGNSNTAIIDSTTSKKYTNPGQKQPNFNEKMKLAPELKNVLEISEKVDESLPKKANTKYPKWEYYKVQFKLGNQTFEGLVNIGVDSNNNKHLYEVNNIKKTSGISETSPNRPTGFSIDNISQNNKNVKSDTSSTKYSIQETQNNTQELDNSSFSLKQKQNDIIQKYNPVDKDSRATWIRSANDIKTLEETLQDSDWSDYDAFNPDLTRQDIENAIKKGTITVYSSYPIEQGIFVSPSKMEAESYSGNGKVYSKEVNINDVAWIDPTQGQYAKVDTKYSKDNKTWQEYLESNFNSKGTKTNLKELKSKYAPKVVKETPNVEKNTTRKIDVEIKKETPIKEINQKKIENNENAIKRLTQEKDALTERIKKKIAEKQELLKSKANKDSKLATQLNIQISNLNNQLQNRQLDYDKRIDYYKNKNEKMNSEEFKTQEQRITKKQEYLDQAYEMTENMVDWKDKKRGVSYQVNTMKRNLHDIMSKSEADKMYNTYFQPITENNAKSEKFIDSYNERIKKLNLNDKESQAVQMLGEYKYNKETLVTGAQVDEFISKNHLDYDKLSNAVEEFRTIYDELITETNRVLKEQGYKEIEYRKGYFPHFQEETKPGKFAKLAEKLGFKVNKSEALPTDIAGLTEIFKPGKTYFKNAQRRLGKVTDYNALKGYDNYIRGAADLIFHTEDIQKLRALENVIRTQYTDNSIKETIEKINNNPDYDMDQKQALIDLEYAKINNPLPNLVTELRNYTDSLANKKDIGDRGMEHMLGRETYTIMKNVQSRVSANMVGFNISSALTNFIPITQAWGEVSTKNMLKAIKQSISNQFRNDGFADASTYLINRTQQADRLYQTGLDKVNSKAGAIFEAVDSITSNVIVRGKYLDNIDKGMAEVEAMKNANEFAKDIMAGRSKGDMPTIFNQKNPLVKLFTAFQLEVNNQYGYMLKDLPRNLSDETKKKLAMAFVKMFIGAWLYNKFSESVTGRKSAFSPIDIVSDSVETVNNDNLSDYDKISGIFKDITQDVPFIGGLAGGGRLPINAALPDVGTTVESFTQLGDDKKRTTAINNLKKELSKPLFYVAMPFGGGQLKKTIEGGSMYLHETPGSYTSSGRLRFEAPKSPIGVAQSLLFGQYSSKNAREYFDNGYAPLTEKQIKDWKDLDVSFKEYRKYRQDFTQINQIKGDKDENDKTIKGTASGKKAFEIMNDDSLSKKEKDYLLKSISSSEKYTITTESLNKIANDEEVYKYFYSLSSKSKKQFINDIDEKGFNSHQLYDYYKTKKEYTDTYANSYAKDLIINYLTTSNMTDTQKYYLYSKDYASNDTVNLLKQFNIGANNYLNTMKYVNQIKTDYQGDIYKNYRRQLTYEYIQGLNASVLEKAILYKQAGYSISNYKNTMYQYIENLQLSAREKKKLWEQLY